MAEEFRVLRPREYHTQLISKGQRADGRALDELREVKLETDAIRTADSSSLVKLGNTSLVCGCTSQILKRRDDEEVEEIKIKVELPPICSSPTGLRTQHTAQLLTRTLKNILDDSNCLDKKEFHLRDEANTYLSIDIEVICLNYDGCILDAALLAILSALKSLRLSNLPIETISSEVKFNAVPICSSFAVIGDRVICDPNLEEETVAQSTFSIAVDPSTSRICHINKIGGRSLTSSDLFECIEMAKKRATHLEKIINDIKNDLRMDGVD